MILFDTANKKLCVEGDIENLVMEAGFLVDSLDKQCSKVTGRDHLFLRALLALLQEETVDDGRN